MNASLRASARQSLPERSRGSPGFTLIEILIVISIIALLSSFVLVAVSKGRQTADSAMAKTDISSLSQALEQYVADESEYPGMDLPADPERNDFPLLFDALFGERRPNGPGGRSAPYTQLKEDKALVYDDDTEQYRAVSREELLDPKVKKYLSDPFGNPYVYRANKGKKREDYMHNMSSADIYSLGPNGKDDTVNPEEKSDDIGNW